MKKRVLSLLCMALLCVIAFTVPALAAEQTVRYPISVEEYTEGGVPRIKKVYQLSLNEDPVSIPTEDFERFGYVYHLLDVTQHNDEGVDVKDCLDTITQDSDTGELAVVLKRLDGQREITTEDGYSGLNSSDATHGSDGYSWQVKVVYPAASVEGQEGTVQLNLSSVVVQYELFHAKCLETDTYGIAQRYVLDADPHTPIPASALGMVAQESI